MKDIIVYFLVVMLAWFPIGRAGAQAPFLNDLLVLPENPDENDTIRISWVATTGNWGREVGHTFSRNGNQIDVEGCYQEGLANTPCSHKDTVVLGLLSKGDYRVDLRTYVSSDTANCIPIDSNSTWKTFTVADATGIDPGQLIARPVLVFPNPARDALNVLSGEAWQRLVIFDIQGRRIKTIPNTGSNQINISDIAAGVYFLELQLQSRNKMVKLIRE